LTLGKIDVFRFRGSQFLRTPPAGFLKTALKLMDISPEVNGFSGFWLYTAVGGVVEKPLICE
jgi:hypothetical protein